MLPTPEKVLGRRVNKLCRRVITDTGTGQILADEYVHGRLCVQYLRRELHVPGGVEHIRMDYCRLPLGHTRVDSSSSASENSDAGAV